MRAFLELVRRVGASPWRDPLIAAGIFGFGVLLYLAGLYTLRPNPPDRAPPWRLAVLAAGCAAELLRRRRPGLALLLAVPPAVIDTMSGLSLPMTMVVADLLYCATLRTSDRFSRAMVAAAAISPAVAFGALLFPAPDWRTALLWTLQIVALPVIPVAWGREVRQHRNAARLERTRAGQLTRIAELDRRAAIDAERSRMARDLHDVIAGQLSAIAIQSEAVLSAKSRDPATVHTVLGSIRQNSVAALAEMRAMIELLRTGGDRADDPVTAPARLAELHRLVDSARAGGLRVDAGPPPDLTGLTPVVELTAYRIVQEALTNAVKHANGGHATVRLHREAGHLVIEVTNELTGPTQPDRTTGIGLATMTERAVTIGGAIHTGPCDGRWRVRATLPVEGGRVGFEGGGRA